MSAFRIKKNDRQPYYKAQVVDSDGSAFDLTGTTIKVTMRVSNGGAVKINAATTGIVVTNAANGEFEYRWQAGDTDTIAQYDIEFLFTPPSGDQFTLPLTTTENVLVLDRL